MSQPRYEICCECGEEIGDGDSVLLQINGKEVGPLCEVCRNAIFGDSSEEKSNE